MCFVFGEFEDYVVGKVVGYYDVGGGFEDVVFFYVFVEGDVLVVECL